MKLCKDCEYFSGSNFCSAPQNGISPIDGKYQARFASQNRSAKNTMFGGGACGEEARFFKKKEVVKTPWWKFWS